MMNQWIAQMYGTNGAPAAEETTKLANAELFAKLAAKNNIDLSQLSPDQVGELYAQVFPEEAMKLAQESEEGESEEHEKGEEEEGEEAKEKKEAAAIAHWQEKRAFQEKFAEADLMGRVMAHAFTQELQNIKLAQEGEGGEDEEHEKKEPPKKEEGEEEKKEGAARQTFQKNANAMAFEELSARRAIEMAKQAGYDVDEAFNRVNAVYVLGLEESTKIASMQTPEQAMHVRALEYLEQAKYPVNWAEVLGS